MWAASKKVDWGYLYSHVTRIMPRSQEFGFFIENLVRTRIHGLPEKSNDTGIHDIPKEENCLDPTETQSIKTTGNNAIDCGDVLRVYDYNRAEKHTMIVFRYDQEAAIRRVKEVLEIQLTAELMDALFGKVSRAEIEALDTYVKSIPKNARTEEHQMTYKKMAQDLKARSGGWISYAPKVDSRAQRRLQCSIRDLDAFVAKYPQFIKKTQGCSLRGYELPAEHPFGRRIRNKKPESHSELHSPPASKDSVAPLYSSETQLH